MLCAGKRRILNLGLTRRFSLSDLVILFLANSPGEAMFLQGNFSVEDMQACEAGGVVEKSEELGLKTSRSWVQMN